MTVLTNGNTKLTLAGTEHQPHARLVLGNALASLAADGRPGVPAISHAYLFQGPSGVGKRDVARSFAASVLAEGNPDPEGARRRANAGIHPDLTWIVPRGAHGILVEDVREEVNAQIWKRPFEGKRRVFVIAQAELMNAEAANALLKTLEEPPPYAHLVLTSDMPERLPETVRSRCQPVRFCPLPERLVSEALVGEGTPEAQALACARLSGGDLDLAGRLAAEEGEELRQAVERAAGSAIDSGQLSGRPWMELLRFAEDAGEAAEDRAKQEMGEKLEMLPSGRERQGVNKQLEQSARRARRRAQTQALDLELKLLAYWFRDLAAVSQGAKESLLNVDRASELERLGRHGLRPLAYAVQLCDEARRRLRLNVTPELALEALFYRFSAALG